MMPIAPVTNAQRKALTARRKAEKEKERKADIQTKGLCVGMKIWFMSSPKQLKPTQGIIAEITNDWYVRLEGHGGLLGPRRITPR